MSTFTKHDEDEGGPECAHAGAASTMPSRDVQDKLERFTENDGRGLLIVDEGGSDTSSSETWRRPSARSTQIAQREHRIPLAKGAAEPWQSGSRREGRRRERCGRGGGGKRRRNPLPPSPPRRWQPSPTTPFPLTSPSLTGAQSIYSSLGGTEGLSRPISFGVITGPFTNRQGSFRENHIRPRTADGRFSPIRSATSIFVTTRSNFDFSGQSWHTGAGSVGSPGGQTGRGRQKCSATYPTPGSEDTLGNNWRGWEGKGTSSSAISYSSSSDHHPRAHRQQSRPKTVPLDAMHASSHGRGGRARTWISDLTTTRVRSARLEQSFNLGSRSGGGAPDRANGNAFDCYNHRGVRRARAAAAWTTRTGLAGSGGGGFRCPKGLILSPERVAARLARIRKAYGRESASPFRGSSLHASASLKSVPLASASAHRGGG